MTLPSSAFALPAHRVAKADPALIGGDERALAAVGQNLARTVTELSDRLAALRKTPGRAGQQALERDLEIHRLAGRLRALRRFGQDMCLGRLVGASGGEPVYVGRFGLKDQAGAQLLVDWRSPAAEPFFGATHANPMGLLSRRRYRWSGGRVVDYWDEVFTPEGLESNAALDDQSAFIASLGVSRSDRMRDVLATIAADQDTIVRAGSGGTLVVDGGPGTGKTVVALHRAAYLLYADPRLGHRRGGVLFVGPHRPYLAYIADVLPSLGEEGVLTATLADLVPEGATAAVEADPEVARLKASARMVAAIEPAVRLYEEPPTRGTRVETPWGQVRLTAADWAQAFDAPEPGTPHNEALEQVWDELVAILTDRLGVGEGEDAGEGGVPDDVLRRSLRHNAELRSAVNRGWPVVEANDLVGDLWSVPAYLRRCAPWLSRDEVLALQRADPQAWTVSDLPLLDAARHRLGDPQASARQHQREAAEAAGREEMARVVDHLIASDDSEMQIMSMLRGSDLQAALVDESALPSAHEDSLAGPFAHVVVDEAQELTEAEWQMLRVRCPSGSFTVVGDRAQARRGFAESWQQRLERVGLRDVSLASLSINYRTPAEVMAEAAPVIRAALPDANVPSSIRSTGIPVVHGTLSDLEETLDAWLGNHDGIAGVIGDESALGAARVVSTARLRVLTPQLCKGLEFDLVVLLDPEPLATGIEAAVDRYVAMTRATQQLVILTGD